MATNMARTRVRSSVGERVVAAIPQAHWQSRSNTAPSRMIRFHDGSSVPRYAQAHNKDEVDRSRATKTGQID
jgi:phage baseplate assembly protein gpV